MRLTTNGKELKDAITWGAKGINRTLGEHATGAQTVLAVENGYLTVKSFDGHKFFTARVAVSGITEKESIEARIYGETLISVTNVLTNEPVTMEFSDSEVKFILARSEFSIPRSGVRGPKFPELPTKIGIVNAGELRKVVTKAATTTLKDSTAQPALGAVLLEFAPAYSRLRVEATNRISLFVYDLDYVTEHQHAVDLEEDVLSTLISHELIRTLFSGVRDDEDVTMYANEQFFGIEGGNYAGFVTQVAADPINYKQLMDMPMTKSLTFNCKELITAVKNVSSLSQGVDTVFLRINPNGVMRVTDNSEKARAEVDIENVTGMEVEEDEEAIEVETGEEEGEETGIDAEEVEAAHIETIKFNTSAILSALNAATTEKVALTYIESTRPTVLREIKIDGTVDKQFFYMAMPLR